MTTFLLIIISFPACSLVTKHTSNWDSICEIPRVRDMIQNTVDLTLWHPAFLRVGSIRVCVSHSLSLSLSQSTLASVCVSCWLPCISVCQLGDSRCLRHLVDSNREEISGFLLIRDFSDRDPLGLHHRRSLLHSASTA